MKEWKKGEKFYYIKRTYSTYEICCTKVLKINRYDNHQRYVPRNDTAAELEYRDMFEQWADAKLSAYVDISVRTTDGHGFAWLLDKGMVIKIFKLTASTDATN